MASWVIKIVNSVKKIGPKEPFSFQGWWLSVLLTSSRCDKRSVPIYTVVQHWLLAINCDCITIGLSSSPLYVLKLVLSIFHRDLHITWRSTPTAKCPLHHTISVTLNSPDSRPSSTLFADPHQPCLQTLINPVRRPSSTLIADPHQPW